jgi:hypothetical protein
MIQNAAILLESWSLNSFSGGANADLANRNNRRIGYCHRRAGFNAREEAEVATI